MILKICTWTISFPSSLTATWTFVPPLASGHDRESVMSGTAHEKYFLAIKEKQQTPLKKNAFLPSNEDDDKTNATLLGGFSN